MLRAWLLAMTLALSGCSQVMFSKVSEQDANEMIAVLGTAGVRASKSDAGDSSWKLEVASGDFAQAVLVLKEHGLPRPVYASIGQVFKREGLVSTPMEERVRFIYAQQQELENTLSRLPGVVVARVHVVTPQNDPLATTVKPSSASVVLIHRHGADLQSSVPQIKALVGHSIEGLSHEAVSMSLFPAKEMRMAVATDEGRDPWFAPGGDVLRGMSMLALAFAMGIAVTLLGRNAWGRLGADRGAGAKEAWRGLSAQGRGATSRTIGKQDRAATMVVGGDARSG